MCNPFTETRRDWVGEGRRGWVRMGEGKVGERLGKGYRVW